MKNLFLAALGLLCVAPAAIAAGGESITFAGSASTDGGVLFQTTETQLAQFDRCVIMSTTGAVEVFVSLDGTNFATQPLSMQDLGAETTAPVLETTALRIYGFVVRARAIKVAQSGATGAAATMICW